MSPDVAAVVERTPEDVASSTNHHDIKLLDFLPGVAMSSFFAGHDKASRIQIRNFFSTIFVALVVMGVAVPATQAANIDDNPTFDTLFQPAKVNAKWKQECSGCHIPFPPGLLQAESWIKIMESLDSHFGVDASLTANETREITRFLVNNASTRWRSSVPPSRISDATWFKNVHYLHESFWNRPLVKSPSNCFACHKHADHGDFYGGGGGCGGVSSCHQL